MIYQQTRATNDMNMTVETPTDHFGPPSVDHWPNLTQKQHISHPDWKAFHRYPSIEEENLEILEVFEVLHAWWIVFPIQNSPIQPGVLPIYQVLKQFPKGPQSEGHLNFAWGWKAQKDLAENQQDSQNNANHIWSVNPLWLIMIIE